LTGEVDWQFQKAEAAYIVHRLTGVVDVVNQIRVVPRSGASDIKQKIERALRRSAALDASRITVETEGGGVVLTGKVEAWYQRDIVERAAWSAPGVTEVQNRLTIALRPAGEAACDTSRSWMRWTVEHHAEVLRGRIWHQRVPSWRDLATILLVLGIVILLGTGARQMVAPFVIAHQPKISLSPAALPFYVLRTVMRMLAALVLSLIFTFTYATLAGKSRRAEMVLIPILDVLQSVPILGYLSFTVVFFLSLFPGNTFGPELAAVFAIFTSQAWNMAFSFYQALRTIPSDLDEASRSFRSSFWQRFWRLEVPFAMPGLVWNMMLSMSSGWFFVVASEAISVGDIRIALPGVGSYVARAIQRSDLPAVGWAIVAMTIAIVLYDQLLFRRWWLGPTSSGLSRRRRRSCPAAWCSICFAEAAEASR
jgi:NitT/TauT family transport system permease protein